MKTDEELVRELLREGIVEQFAPGFDSRTLARWKRAREGDVTPLLARQFRKLVPLAAAASLLLALHNTRARHADAGQSVVEALFGVRHASSSDSLSTSTVQSLYQLNSLLSEQ